jgi:hypothetical protein
MMNLPNPLEPVPLPPPPRPVVWHRAARAFRGILVGASALLTVAMLTGAAAAWQAGVREVAAACLFSPLPLAVVVGLWEWLIRHERDLARRGELAVGRITASGINRVGKGTEYPYVCFEFPLPSGEVVQSQSDVPRELYDRLGQAGSPVAVLWDPRRPRRCRPVLAFRFVEFPLPTGGTLAPLPVPPRPAPPEAHGGGNKEK